MPKHSLWAAFHQMQEEEERLIQQEPLQVLKNVGGRPAGPVRAKA